MNRMGSSAQRASRGSSRGIGLINNYKGSSSNYGISMQRNGYYADQSNNRTSQKSAIKKTTNYEYSTSNIKSLLRDKNVNIYPTGNPNNRQNKAIQTDNSKNEGNKKQFRIRQKDTSMSNSRKSDREEQEKEKNRQLYQGLSRQEEMQKQVEKRKEDVKNNENLLRGQNRKNNGYGSYSTSKTIGLVGLNNIGNTCFMNSILQCMFNLPGFNDYFLNGSYLNQINSGARVAEAYAKTIKLMRTSSSRSETPSQLKNAIGAKRSRFMGYAQQDAQQFLAGLLELLSIDLNRVKKPKYKQLTADTTKYSLSQISDDWWSYNRERQNSIVCDFFSGQILSRVVCSRCGNQSIAFDNIWDMALNFSRNDDGDLQKMIQNFLKEETISSDYFCSKCKTFRECRRKIDFYRLPKILVFQLKRFSYGGWRKTKLNNRVKVQTFLNLSKFISKSEHFSVKQPIYELVGVVNHSGGIDFGHYTAECKNPINGKWYNFNDSSVHQTRMRDDFESSSPYVLFYAKRQ